MSEKKCANPECCGSDGTDCCNPACDWSPWNWLLRLVRKERDD